MRASLVVVVLLLSPALARADAKADVTKAFASFIDGVATKKAPSVEMFIVPGDDDHVDDEPLVKPVPDDFSVTGDVIGSAKLKTAKVVVSPGGKSAWIAGEITGRIPRDANKYVTEPIRVSAFLAASDKGWRVVATHWSTGEKDVKSEYCGMRDPWRPVESIPKDATPIVKLVFDALQAVDFVAGKGPIYDSSKFTKILSDDKNAYVIGSAPKEVFAGAKIKAIFKKWKISAESGDPGKYPARAGVGPDGEMAWIAMGMNGPEALCVSYRTFMVLSKEPSGWKVVHQHYSKPTGR